MANTIRTEADLLNNVFQDGQAPGSITAQDMRDLIVSAQATLPLGWEFLFDNDYTSGSPLTLSDGVGTKLTINSNPAEELRYPADFPGAWDDINNRLLPALLNGFGIIRISFTAVYVGGTAPHLDFKLDVGSDPVDLGGVDSNVIYIDSANFAKASGTAQSFNFIMPLFVGTDFSNNGGTFILTADGDDIDIYDIAMTAARIFSPLPFSGFGA